MPAEPSVVPGVAPPRPGDPTRLGRWTILGRLGQGGMGVVYLGRDDGGRPGPPERLVAVKVIRTEHAADAEFRARFRREAENAQRVRRFCTAPVLAADIEGDLPYIVTEFVRGPTLAGVVAQQGALSGSDLEGLAVGVAAALRAIHAAGVVHRDLKPSNVLLSPVGPRVIDFGIARALDDTTSVTHSGQRIVGTPAFMSPEQAQGRPATRASDVFAWGGLIAYAGTGRQPFRGESVPAILLQVTYAEPDLAGLDPQLRELVELAMRKDPAGRPTAEGLLERLLAGAGGTSTVSDVLQQAATPVGGAAAPAATRPPTTAAATTAAGTTAPATTAAGTTAPATRAPATTAAGGRRRRTALAAAGAVAVALLAVAAGVLLAERHTGTHPGTVQAVGGGVGDQRFRITGLGASVVPDSPAGAGRIEQRGAKDTYSFTVPAGHDAYLDFREDDVKGTRCAANGLHWTVASGGVEKTGGAFACGASADPSADELLAAGAYELVVDGGDEGGATGTYGFTLWDSPQDRFALGPGEVVSPDHPRKGAGRLEAPAATDSYTFAATGGARLQLQYQGPGCDAKALEWTIVDQAGDSVDSGTFACGSSPYSTPVAVPRDGRYTLVVDGTRPTGAAAYATGAYAFRFINPGVQKAQLTLGARVQGRIAAAGGSSVYAFAGHPGQRVYLDFQSDPCDGDGLSWELDRAGAGGYVDGGNLRCQSNPDPSSAKVLDRQGSYQLTISSDRGGTGSYAFVLWSAPERPRPAVALGATVGGTIGTPGVRDRYRFTASAGQTVTVEPLGDPCRADGTLEWEIDDAGGDYVGGGSLGACDSSPSPEEVKLEGAGSYLLRVDGRYDATGPYRLRLR
jgi:predicted Ser/Thr protein kinase